MTTSRLFLICQCLALAAACGGDDSSSASGGYPTTSDFEVLVEYPRDENFIFSNVGAFYNHQPEWALVSNLSATTGKHMVLLDLRDGSYRETCYQSPEADYPPILRNGDWFAGGPQLNSGFDYQGGLAAFIVEGDLLKVQFENGVLACRLGGPDTPGTIESFTPYDDLSFSEADAEWGLVTDEGAWWNADTFVDFDAAVTRRPIEEQAIAQARPDFDAEGFTVAVAEGEDLVAYAQDSAGTRTELARHAGAATHQIVHFTPSLFATWTGNAVVITQLGSGTETTIAGPQPGQVPVFASDGSGYSSGATWVSADGSTVDHPGGFFTAQGTVIRTAERLGDARDIWLFPAGQAFDQFDESTPPIGSIEDSCSEGDSCLSDGGVGVRSYDNGACALIQRPGTATLSDGTRKPIGGSGGSDVLVTFDCSSGENFAELVRFAAVCLDSCGGPEEYSLRYPLFQASTGTVSSGSSALVRTGQMWGIDSAFSAFSLTGEGQRHFARGRTLARSISIDNTGTIRLHDLAP